MGAPWAAQPVDHANSAQWETAPLEEQHPGDNVLPVGRRYLDHPRNKQFSTDMKQHAQLCNDEFYSMCEARYSVVALDEKSGKWKESKRTSSRAFFIRRKEGLWKQLKEEDRNPTALPATVNLLAGLDQILEDINARISLDDANDFEGHYNTPADGSGELGGGGDSTAFPTQVGCCSNNAELVEKTLGYLGVPAEAKVLDLTTGEGSECVSR